MKKHVILLAGGKGTRMNAAVNKVLLDLCGKPVILRSAEAFSSLADDMIIVCRAEDQPVIESIFSRSSLPFPVYFTSGGNTRQESVLNGVRMLSAGYNDIILIHDAARCLVNQELISRVIESVLDSGTGIPGIPATSTFKICNDEHYVMHTPDRSSLYEIQTPQGFAAEVFIPAALKAAEDGIDCTDDAGILEHYHIPVHIVPGSSQNIKLTEPEDMSRASSILKGDAANMRIGMGYDVHRLTDGRKLILCGVEVPFSQGLLGHSDADVALHALMDAMFGACALGDIGKHFPDTSDLYKDISSVFLLKETNRIIGEAGYKVSNTDITIVAQKPKLLPFIPQMTEIVADTLGIPLSAVNIKATTTEKLGFEGRMEGISAYAVCAVTDRTEKI